jgi:hypothetical protein
LEPRSERRAEHPGELAGGVNQERPHSSLDYRTPEEFRQRTGYADVESKVRFLHPHSLDDGDENEISKQNQNRETPVISG